MARKIHVVRLTSRGQVTIPRSVRELFGLKRGDRLEFVVESGRILVRRAQRDTSPFAQYAGTLGTFRGGKKGINAWLRALRDE